MKTNTTLFSFVVVLFILVQCNQLLASTHQIINYSSKDYQSHSVNYAFVQDSEGLMYVGNAYGVLVYDGVSWRKIPLVDGKSALSLAINNQGIIYVGSSSEFGYITRKPNGSQVYVSLKELMPEKEIGEILNTYAIGDEVYFHSYKGVFRLANNQIEKVDFNKKTLFIYDLEYTSNGLFAYDYEYGYYFIEGLKAKKINASVILKEQVEIGFVGADTLFFLENIIYKNKKVFTNELSKITCKIDLPKNQILVGTENNGLYILNENGEIVINYTKSFGLKDNHIRNLFKDANNDIWIAYNNGIGLLKWNSAVKYINSSKSTNLSGMGLASAVLNDTLYLGTTQGLYYLPNWEKNIQKVIPFKQISGVSGQINNLAVSNNKLIVVDHAEVYQLSRGKLKLISDGRWQGSWIWKEGNKKNTAFVGNYTGLSKYIYQNNNWKLLHKIKGFSESSRVMEITEDGIIWVVQGNKGLYRVELNKAEDEAISVLNYSEKLGVANDHFNDIFKFNNQIYVTSYSGVYQIKNDSLIPEEMFSKIKNHSSRVRKISESELYSIYDDQAHPLTMNNGYWEIYNSEASFLESSLVGSAEHFNKILNNTYLIGTEDGFVLYQPKKEQQSFYGSCLIREVTVMESKKDSLLYVSHPDSNFVLKYSQNNLRIGFSIPLYGVSKQITYETKLVKNGKIMYDWQVARDANYREYTNLSEGNYTFEVRAKKGTFVMGSKKMSFVVNPPWYRTKWAMVFYLILFGILVYVIIKRFEKQRIKLLEENKRELEIKEKLHNAEKLELDLKNKENELAYIALTYTQKKELLNNLVTKLDALGKELEFEGRKKVESIIRMIEGKNDDESNWENFQVHFDEKNNNFFQKLKQIDPKISEAYLLFCSYVKMGKSNKEIADLLNISVAAVEKRKYRIKKKWNIPNDDNFTDFLKEL